MPIINKILYFKKFNTNQKYVEKVCKCIVFKLCTATKHLHKALGLLNFNKMLKSSDDIFKSSDDVPRIMRIGACRYNPNKHKGFFCKLWTNKLARDWFLDKSERYLYLYLIAKSQNRNDDSSLHYQWNMECPHK